MDEQSGADATIHVHAQSWKDSWKSSEAGPSGGQASSKIGELNGKRVFIKILSRQRDKERRRRMYREVTALETLDHPGIPRLLETNVRHYEESDFDLYFVSEYVGEVNLADWVGTQKASLEIALSITLNLAEIVRYCHDNDVVHRDIKPDNIVINDPDTISLVDFGMVHNNASDDDLRTQASQALGNRFLILPELQVGSELKRDPRSDVACIVGILFYLLTGRFPAVLTDEAGAMPHQRVEALESLKTLYGGRSDLFAIFSRGFQYQIDRRYQTCQALVEDLRRIATGPSVFSDSADGILGRIRAEIASPIELADLDLLEKFRNLSTQFRDLTHAIVKDVGPSIHYIETGGGPDLARGRMDFRVGFKRATKEADGVWPLYEVETAGTEFTISVAFKDSPLLKLRVPIADARLSTLDIERLRTYLLRGIEVLVRQ